MRRKLVNKWKEQSEKENTDQKQKEQKRKEPLERNRVKQLEQDRKEQPKQNEKEQSGRFEKERLGRIREEQTGLTGKEQTERIRNEKFEQDRKDQLERNGNEKLERNGSKNPEQNGKKQPFRDNKTPPIKSRKKHSIQPRKGLTVLEKKRLKELKRKIAEMEKQGAVLDTAQKSIPFEHIYPDGICHVGGKFYTKVIEFRDINYVLLDDAEKKDILASYSSLINSFGPSMPFQLFLFNRKANMKSLSRKFSITLQGDGDDEIRREFEQILKKQAGKGTNGIMKSKYLLIGAECADRKEAAAKLSNAEREIIRNFSQIGVDAGSLSGERWLEVLHEYFNQATMEQFSFSYRKMNEELRTEKDFIAPPWFDFRGEMQFRCGKMHGSSFYVNILASQFSDELMKNLLDIDDNLTISLHMRTMNPADAFKMLKNALSEVQKNKIDEQKKAVRSGYDMDLIPPDILDYEKNTLELLNDLNSSNQKIIRVSFFLTCFGRTRQELDALVQRVSGIIQQSNCILCPLTCNQEAGLMSTAPIGTCMEGFERILTTKSTAILVPFNTRELFMGGQSLYYGINALSNNMIMADRKQLRTPNGVILGTPGSGKSFSAKREILGAYLVTTDDILICDPEMEYIPLVTALGGGVVRLAADSVEYLNPMDLQPGKKDDREAIRLKSDFIITLCDLVAGGPYGLANDEKGIIDKCIRQVYAVYFENPIPERMPILEDLYDALLRYDPVDVAPELREDAKKKAIRIANSLVLYVHGSQNYFNHRTNVDSQSRIVCFDIRDLGNQLKALGMLVVQEMVWNRVTRNRERKIATRYFCDEFHILLRERQTAQYCVEIWKRFRKWGGIPTALTQNVADFLKSEEIEGILGNSDFIVLLNQSGNDQEILMDKFGLSATQMKCVTNSEQGCGLLLFDDAVIQFVDRYPTDTMTYKIMNTKPDASGTEEESQDEKGENKREGGE